MPLSVNTRNDIIMDLDKVIAAVDQMKATAEDIKLKINTPPDTLGEMVNQTAKLVGTVAVNAGKLPEPLARLGVSLKQAQLEAAS